MTVRLRPLHVILAFRLRKQKTRGTQLHLLSTCQLFDCELPFLDLLNRESDSRRHVLSLGRLWLQGTGGPSFATGLCLKKAAFQLGPNLQTVNNGRLSAVVESHNKHADLHAGRCESQRQRRMQTCPILLITDLLAAHSQHVQHLLPQTHAFCV